MKSRCDGKIILADVKISRWMDTMHADETKPGGGNPMALLFDITGGELTAIHAIYGDFATDKVRRTNLKPSHDDASFDGARFERLIQGANARVNHVFPLLRSVTRIYNCKARSFKTYCHIRAFPEKEVCLVLLASCTRVRKF